MLDSKGNTSPSSTSSQTFANPPRGSKLSFFTTYPRYVEQLCMMLTSQTPVMMNTRWHWFLLQVNIQAPTHTPDTFTVYWSHKICSGFEVMHSHDYLQASTFEICFQKPPACIIYDNSFRYVLNKSFQELLPLCRSVPLPWSSWLFQWVLPWQIYNSRYHQNKLPS